ncbi:MAG: hypothetical protein CMP10_14920 [Zetaproteobacteria bacterium]|nr:hypothetical protein [Pseudobdellovibrionaceae bacterium]
MSEQVWYLYQNGQQIGPFDSGQLNQLYSTKMIAQDGYIFKVGWKDWRPFEDCCEELGLSPEGGASGADVEQKRQGRPRASVSGRVIVHNDGQLSIGNGVNISDTGMFVETKEQIFSIGEQLKVSIRCDGLTKAFNVLAEVVRFNNDARYPIGYGFRFLNLETQAQKEIQNLVAQENQVKNSAMSQ